MFYAQDLVSNIRQTINRALSTIDSVRPKILIKKPLSELLQGSAVGAAISGELGIAERVMRRIEEIRSAARGSTVEAEVNVDVSETEDSGEINALEIVKQRNKQSFLY